MYSKYKRFGDLFVTLEACLRWNDNIHNYLLLVKVGFKHMQEAHSEQETSGSENGI
jgi:hypothetical protein